jgi:thymidylate synthase (FAD)
VDVELVALTPGAETLIERAGRTCYMSHSKTGPESAGRFIRALVARGHLSVLEHACATFRIAGVSRVTTHQLVRHRLCSFSQRSQRYVLEGPPEFVVPPSVAANPRAGRVYAGAVGSSHRAYRALVALGIPKEDARFVMPGAATSEIVLTANFRELRHLIQVRGARSAQWEIRRLAVAMLRILKRHAPNAFCDLAVTRQGWVERRCTTNLALARRKAV